MSESQYNMPWRPELAFSLTSYGLGPWVRVLCFIEKLHVNLMTALTVVLTEAQGRAGRMMVVTWYAKACYSENLSSW